MDLAKSGVKTLNFRRVNFSELFEEWLNEISKEAVLRHKGMEHSWQNI